ncbi:MAG TPA: hypothetical protein VJT70_07370 [Sphingomicrobium sp.]|nr:hypothetical protein [Sphingomicrobium sp.]
MNVGKTGSILFQMYVGTLALVWAVAMILGGGALVYIGMEPFKTRGMVMIGLGALVLFLSGLRIAHAARKPKDPQLASDAQRDFDADEAIRRYLEQKASAAPEPPIATKPPAAAAAPAPVQRPVFGRRGAA